MSAQLVLELAQHSITRHLHISFTACLLSNHISISRMCGSAFGFIILTANQAKRSQVVKFQIVLTAIWTCTGYTKQKDVGFQVCLETSDWVRFRTQELSLSHSGVVLADLSPVSATERHLPQPDAATTTTLHCGDGPGDESPQKVPSDQIILSVLQVLFAISRWAFRCLL